MCRKDFDRGLRNADVHGFRLLAGVCAFISMLPGLHMYACWCRIGSYCAMVVSEFVYRVLSRRVEVWLSKANCHGGAHC
jgi:hypothetical protein